MFLRAVSVYLATSITALQPVFFAEAGQSETLSRPVRQSSSVRLGLRLHHEPSEWRWSPSGRYLAYEARDQMGLFVMEAKTGKAFQVSARPIRGSFVWSPWGHRLFFRETFRVQKRPRSIIRVFDVAKKASLTLETLDAMSSRLTLDPRDLRLHFFAQGRFHSKKLRFPGNRLAKWQQETAVGLGKWVVGGRRAMWVTGGGKVLNALEDDGSGIESFALSKDGEWLTWSTQEKWVYVSHLGKSPSRLGRGRDPSWHPRQHLIVYSGARMVGRVIRGYDLKLQAVEGRGRFVTDTQFFDESLPRFHPKKERVFFAKKASTDLFYVDVGADLALR